MKDKHKITKGQFFTTDQIWLKKQVEDFIVSSDCSISYDPFAGAGDLIRCSELYGIKEMIGLDIDPKLGWSINDSLQKIPHIDKAIIITNPPYLSSYSASRKKVYDDVAIYFERTKYDDLYLLALDKMLEAQQYIVAIIPETFINSNYQQKNKLSSITILEDNPFNDTDTPVCVVCFDGVSKDYSQIKVFKNEEYISTLETIESTRLHPQNDVAIRFNVLDGWLGLRAVDTTNPQHMISFDYKELFEYNWDKGIKISSRLLSIIDINIPDSDKAQYICECNRVLEELRNKSNDIILSPFKGNMKNGRRRRRLDFYTARAIMEIAYHNIYGEDSQYAEQLRIF